MRYADQREGQMKRCLLLIGLVALLAFLIGCAGPSRVEMDYGTSYKLNKFNQILDPEAEKNLQPVVGFDGVAAGNAVERYRKGFQEKSEPPVYNITIGNVGSGR